jgi:hypothetical protein
MSPNHLDVLIHYNGFAQPHPRFAAPAVQEAISFWVAQGFLEPDGGSASLFRTTERGKVHIRALCALEGPKKYWLTAEEAAQLKVLRGS